MSGAIALAVLAFAAFFILATIALLGFLVKVLFWAVLFPIRLALKLTFGLLGLALGAIVLPFVLLVAGIAVIGAIVAALFALLAPLLPVLLLVLVGWAIYRASSGSSVRGFAGS
jgi:hypothetical protein